MQKFRWCSNCACYIFHWPAWNFIFLVWYPNVLTARHPNFGMVIMVHNGTLKFTFKFSTRITEFAHYQVKVIWVVYEGFLTQKKLIAKFCELMFVTVFPSRSLRRTWIISFTSVIRYYMKSRHVFKPTAYLKKFSILWVVSWTLFIAIFRSLKWLITVLSCMITSRIEWQPLLQTWRCLLESLLEPG